MPKKDPFEMPYMHEKMEKEKKTEKTMELTQQDISVKKKAIKERREKEFESILEERVSEAQEKEAQRAKKSPQEKTKKAEEEIERSAKLKKMRQELGISKMTKGEKEEAGWDEALAEAKKRLEEDEPSADTEEALKELRGTEKEKVRKYEKKAKLKPRKRGGEADEKFDFSDNSDMESKQFETNPPFSALEKKFFEEGERMNEGTYKKDELITDKDRADAFGKALEKMPAKELEKIGYGAEASELKQIIKDIDARHKMAPESFPYTGAQVVKKFNEIKYLQTEIGRAAEMMSALLKKAEERKKKSGFFGKLFGRKKSFLDLDEFDELKELELDYKGGVIHYKKAKAEYEKIFKPLRDLAEKGAALTIAARQFPDFRV